MGENTDNNTYGVGLDTMFWVEAEDENEALERAAEKLEERVESGDPKVDFEFAVLDQME